MQKLLRDFIQSVSKVNQALAALVEMGQEKQQLIIANQVKELDNLIQKEGIAVANLAKLEGARFKLQERLAAEWRVEPHNLSAREILSRIQEPWPQIFSQLEKEIEWLEENLTSLKDINIHNNELIDQSLDYIAEIQSLLDGDIAGTYSSQGLKADEDLARPRINLLDKKV